MFSVYQKKRTDKNTLPFPLLSSASLLLTSYISVVYLLKLMNQFIVVQSLSRVRLFVTPWTAVHQVSVLHHLPELAQLMSFEWVMPSNHLVLCRPLLLLPSIFPSIRVFSNDPGPILIHYHSLQVSSVAQSCPTLCNPMNHSMPGLPVRHRLPEFTQTHVHWVVDAIQPSHPLSPPSAPALNLSQHHGLFKWVSSLHQVAKVLESQLQQHYSLKFMVYIKFYFMLYRFWQMHMTCIHHNNIIQSSFTDLKSLCSSYTKTCPWNDTVYTLKRLASLRNRRLSFLFVCLWLDSSFLFNAE